APRGARGCGSPRSSMKLRLQPGSRSAEIWAIATLLWSCGELLGFESDRPCREDADCPARHACHATVCVLEETLSAQPGSQAGRGGGPSKPAANGGRGGREPIGEDEPTGAGAKPAQG